MSASQNYMNFDVELAWQELKMDGLFPFFFGEVRFYEPEIGEQFFCQDTK